MTNHFLTAWKKWKEYAIIGGMAGSRRPIFYDTETTGVKPTRDRIVELAAYDPERDRTYCSFINPEVPIPAEASAISGITDEMVRDAPIFREIGPAFVEFCEGDVILVAHNNDACDRLFLDAEYGRIGAKGPPDWKWVDTLKWSRKYRPDLPRHSLQSLREVYGVAANQAHRALDDVKVMHQIFSQMVDDLDWETILSLMDASAQGGLRMPFGKYQGRPLLEVPKDYVVWLAQKGILGEHEALQKQFLELGVIS